MTEQDKAACPVFNDGEPEERGRGFSHYTFDSLTSREWHALLGFYRILRIRVPYGPPGSERLDGSRSSGCHYGMTRQEAREFLWEFAAEVDWHAYLGSK